MVIRLNCYDKKKKSKIFFTIFVQDWKKKNVKMNAQRNYFLGCSIPQLVIPDSIISFIDRL